MGKYGETIYGKEKYGFTRGYIFDRTETDLLKGTAKAYINYDDLNRIENGMEVVSKKHNIPIITKTNWEYQSSGNAVNNFPLQSQMERILGNLNKIISALGYNAAVNIPSSFENMDIYKMNSIERIINDLELL